MCICINRKKNWYFLYMKEFVLPHVGDGDQQIDKFLMCDTQLNFSLVFQD